MKDAACAEASKIGKRRRRAPQRKEQKSSKQNQLGRGAFARRGATEYIQTKTLVGFLRHVNDTRQRAASLRFSRDSARGRFGGGRKK